MIKNLIFDIGGVLVDFRPAGVLKDLGVSEERAKVILRESIASPLWHEMDRGAIPEEEVIAAMRANIPEEMRADYDLPQTASTEGYHLFPGDPSQLHLDLHRHVLHPEQSYMPCFTSR